MLPGLLFGQRNVTRSIETSAGQQVTMTFAHPEQISIEVWDQQTIEIAANVSINMGENDDAFQINVDNSGDILDISTEIAGKEELPERIVIRHGGQDHYFKTGDWSHPDVQAFLNEHGRENIQWMSHGPVMDIAVKIFVPGNIDLNITSKFGLIEMKGVTRSLTINSKHGGLDLAVPQSTGYDFRIDCDWGEVYTNLNLEVAPTEHGKALKAEKIEAKLNGGGKPVHLISEHGNVYLRAL
jgi:hypothetical protein